MPTLYSSLGDKGSGSDPRAQSLPATLACAHFLKSVVGILECVSPAQNDAYVRMFFFLQADWLTQIEREAFQVDHEDGCPYLLNRSGILPCPLHAWGSQLRACPCQCRMAPLSAERLLHRGLFGVVLRSACDRDGLSTPRHIHPSECGALVGLDPAADYGKMSFWHWLVPARLPRRSRQHGWVLA